MHLITHLITFQGHVDAGKSTLMGRLLYELGRVNEKSRHANERESNRAGKSSFSWAWELDGTKEERERGITMDIAMQFLSTTHRQITILDAPGHKDFIPNMISGASQADCALLVVDATIGEFEAGFERGGQTREHLVLVRSLGVSQVVVAVNKLDQVNWEQARYEEVCEHLKTFFGQSGFQSSKTSFVPVGAMLGVNLVERKSPEASVLSQWYRGPTLVDLLDKLEPPVRDIESPLRLPISNVFKGQSSAIGVTGRICSGIVQVGERLRVLPGDETGVVKSIDLDERSVSWASAGSNATLYLTTIDPIHLNIGSVLCPLNDLVPLTTCFSARIIIFDILLPITSGASVELFHHSRDVPATISKLVASLDRATGSVTRKNPRVLTKGTSAEIEITLRGDSLSGTGAVPRPIPIEPFAVNKDMGRILLRRGGETIAAGIVLEICL
ncbi:P-loop containing nucleoside triphosphate hydrolase protein [Boletus coccyginus]|nr:P-loop containing nucleoside triphosphate hydrolase protein [Boletus coccyginus]